MEADIAPDSEEVMRLRQEIESRPNLILGLGVAATASHGTLGEDVTNPHRNFNAPEVEASESDLTEEQRIVGSYRKVGGEVKPGHARPIRPAM